MGSSLPSPNNSHLLLCTKGEIHCVSPSPVLFVQSQKPSLLTCPFWGWWVDVLQQGVPRWPWRSFPQCWTLHAGRWTLPTALRGLSFMPLMLPSPVCCFVKRKPAAVSNEQPRSCSGKGCREWRQRKGSAGFLVTHVLPVLQNVPSE